jgi:hypothetical protein
MRAMRPRPTTSWSACGRRRRNTGTAGATPTYGPDSIAANVRVFELLDIGPPFHALIRAPLALEFVEALLGPDFLISNFTANIAHPGAKSMSLHSDWALVVPEQHHLAPVGHPF